MQPGTGVFPKSAERCNVAEVSKLPLRSSQEVPDIQRDFKRILIRVEDRIEEAATSLRRSSQPLGSLATGIRSGSGDSQKNEPAGIRRVRDREGQGRCLGSYARYPSATQWNVVRLLVSWIRSGFAPPMHRACRSPAAPHRSCARASIDVWRIVATIIDRPCDNRPGVCSGSSAADAPPTWPDPADPALLGSAPDSPPAIPLAPGGAARPA
jgi:hypothetical protein